MAVAIAGARDLRLVSCRLPEPRRQVPRAIFRQGPFIAIGWQASTYELSREGGEGGGPQLAIGDASPRPEEVNAGTRFRLITLRPSRNCRPVGISSSGRYASTCLGSTGGVGLFAGIDGDRSFVKDVVRGLAARKVRIAP